jgi:hypothetical protein
MDGLDGQERHTTQRERERQRDLCILFKFSDIVDSILVDSNIIVIPPISPV